MTDNDLFKQGHDAWLDGKGGTGVHHRTIQDGEGGGGVSEPTEVNPVGTQDMYDAMTVELAEAQATIRTLEQRLAEAEAERDAWTEAAETTNHAASATVTTLTARAEMAERKAECAASMSGFLDALRCDDQLSMTYREPADRLCREYAAVLRANREALARYEALDQKET